MRENLNKPISIVICMFILLTCASRHEYNVPNLQLEDVDGNFVNLHELLDDGPVFICVWALWCSPCIRELDALNPYYEELISYDIHMLAIYPGADSVGEVKSFVEEHEWKYIVLLDPEREVNELYEISAIPTSLAINQKGDIVFTYIGFRAGDETMIVDTLRYLFGD